MGLWNMFKRRVDYHSDEAIKRRLDDAAGNGVAYPVHRGDQRINGIADLDEMDRVMQVFNNADVWDSQRWLDVVERMLVGMKQIHEKRVMAYSDGERIDAHLVTLGDIKERLTLHVAQRSPGSSGASAEDLDRGDALPASVEDAALTAS